MEMQRPIIIALASPKGGVGKSTSCLNIAGALSHAGHRVHVMDLDQTQTLGRWFTNHGDTIAQIAPNLTIATCAEKDFPEAFKAQLRAQAGQGGFILLDLAGSFGETMLKAAALADLTITPSKLSEPDIIEATKLAERIRRLAADVGKVIRHRILINEVPSLLPGYMVAVLSQLSSSGLSRFATMIRARAAYGEAVMTGQTPHYADSLRAPIAKAVAELDHLMEEILAVLEDRVPVEAKSDEAEPESLAA